MKVQRANICGIHIKLCLQSNFLALNAYISKEERSQINPKLQL